MAEVYRQKVESLAAAHAHEDDALRVGAGGAARVHRPHLIPPGNGFLEVSGDLGRMLAAAAGERLGAELGAVVIAGCGGSQPAEFGVLMGGSLVSQS